MQLILTSFGFNSSIIAEKLKNFVFPQGKTVVLLPFAGTDYERTIAREKAGLIRFGFSEDKIILGTKENLKKLSSVDYIFTSGGDTFKLLDYTQKNGILPLVRSLVEDGAVYIGASAGAQLTTTDIEYLTVFDERNFEPESYSALGLCNDIIIPHSDRRYYFEIDASKNMCSPERKLLLIKNDDVVIKNGDSVDFY